MLWEKVNQIASRWQEYMKLITDTFEIENNLYYKLTLAKI
jgi:hypothetical protein